MMDWCFKRRFFKIIFEMVACCMIKSDKESEEQSQMRQWDSLPPELIGEIADRLGVVEVVRFRSVCKIWNSASSAASAKIESAQNYDPWLLLYGCENDDHKIFDQCRSVTTENGIIPMSLPQLDASTTCIASYQGWLLVFKQGGSMFFFHPFSKTMINLPKFPVSELSDHVAAFSSSPTSSDCKVCVISRSTSNDDYLDVQLLRRGGDSCKLWMQYKINCPRVNIDTIKFAAYSKLEKFYFFDHRNKIMSLWINAEKNNTVTWRVGNTVEGPEVKKAKWPKSGWFYTRPSYFNKKHKLGLADAHENVSFSICGTQTELDGVDNFIFNQNINEDSKSLQKKYKAVWIYPRFYQTSPRKQSW